MLESYGVATFPANMQNAEQEEMLFESLKPVTKSFLFILS